MKIMFGKLEMNVYHPVICNTEEEAFAAATENLSSSDIESIQGEIHTKDGSVFPFVFDECKLIWLECVSPESL